MHAMGAGAVLLLAAMGVPEARADDDRPAPPTEAQVQAPSLIIGEILIVGRRDRESAASVLTSAGAPIGQGSENSHPVRPQGATRPRLS